MKAGYEKCPACCGNGFYRMKIISGYVSRDMASDAGDADYEGQPIYETVDIECSYCDGSGEMESEEANRYRHPLTTSNHGLPF